MMRHLPRALYLIARDLARRHGRDFAAQLAIGMLVLSHFTILAGQMSPQEMDTLARRLQQGDHITISPTIAGLILTAFGAIVGVASTLTVRYVNSQNEIFLSRAVDQSVSRFEQRLTERDLTRERFREQQEETAKQTARADHAEQENVIMRIINGKYVPRAEMDAHIKRSEERYTILTSADAKLDERVGRHGVEIQALVTTIKTMEMRLPKNQS